MDTAERQAKLAEIQSLRERADQLEREISNAPTHWEARDFYTAYYATAGFMLGMFGAITSLVVNVIGSALFEQHPLKLIQVYLTFPLGERALQLNDSLTMTIGCCLYLGTGMLLGVPFHVILAYLSEKKSLLYRFVLGTVLAAGMWVGHFYLILAWLQPLLFGGNWIVEQIPAWVGLLTHLVYGWTMVLVFPLGTYVPYRRQTEQT